MENLLIIISLIIAIIGVPTAIFQLQKSYIERNGKKGADIKDMPIEDSNVINDSNVHGDMNLNSQNVTINGDVSINENMQNTNSTLQHNDDDNIILKDTYTSLFAENGRIQSEKITIKNLGNGRVEGKVYLDQQNTYTLIGTFKNRVLTGEFTSVGRFTDERGTINLKLISENILSGFCSFSKISMSLEDQIRMSPYVWVAGDDDNLVNGTYDFCTQCHNENKICCCSSPDIDMPILLSIEAQKLQSQHPRRQRMKDFSHNIGNTQIRQVNVKETANDNETICHCHFYDINENKCKIYNDRPTDCRLFPFDIKLDHNTHEYWIGYYDDLCDRRLPDEDTMKEYAHILRPQIFLLFPYANIINRDDVCEKLNNANFHKLYRINEFLF